MKSVAASQKNSTSRMIAGTRATPVLLLGLLLLQGCSLQHPRAGASHTPSADSLAATTPLVKRNHTDAEIQELYRRYEQADAAALPRGLQAIMRQMVSLPSSGVPVSTRSAAASTEVAAAMSTETEKESLYVEEADAYPFASSKPHLPLSGGFLNNPASRLPKETLEQKIATTRKSSATRSAAGSPSAHEGFRGRLSRSQASFQPVKERIQQAKKVTGELLHSANGALSSAGEAIDRGFAAIKENIASQTPKDVTAPLKSDPLPEPETQPKSVPTTTNRSVQRSAPTATDAIIPAVASEGAYRTAALSPSVASEGVTASATKTDIKEDLKSAKKNFASRFSQRSYSLLREGILVLVLLVGFFLVGWIRMEYEQANRKR